MMGRATSRAKKIFLVSLSLLIVIVPPALASTFTFRTLVGGAYMTAQNWGQTFTIPAGRSGSLTSAGFTVKVYGNTSDVTAVAKIYTSPAKTTLLATSTNTFTSVATAASTWGPINNFVANFSNVAVSENTSYYFELQASSGNYYYAYEGTDTYSGGTLYRDGSQFTNRDLDLAITITSPDTANSVTLSLSNGSNTATFNATSQLRAQTLTDGSVSFFENGKIIPGCRKVQTTSTIAYCNWKPSIHGALKLSAIAYPTDTANYLTGSISVQTIGVAKRTNTR